MTDQGNYNWNIGDDAKSELSGGLGSAEFKPPIDCMYLWWKNGANAYSTTGGVPYFGGWMCNESDIELGNSLMGHRPEKWSPYDLVGNDGAYRAWGSRYVAVAPIGMRRRWIEADVKKKINAHGQLNILCYMAEIIHKDNGKTAVYDPYLPVVLSTKSMSANFVKRAFAEFDKATSASRYQFAGGNPSNVFWQVIGTFGEKPVTQMVGGEQKSPITPCTVYLPQTFDEPTLQSIFVNNDINISGLMLDLKRQCKDWLHAWDDQQGNGGQNQDQGGLSGKSWSDAPPF